MHRDFLITLYLQSIHNKEFESNLLHLHTAGSYWSVRMFTRHTLIVQLSVLTVNVPHKQPQQVMDFSLFLLALFLLWDNYLISEMISIHVNITTKTTPCQPQSVHSEIV